MRQDPISGLNFGIANAGFVINHKAYEGRGRNRREATKGLRSYSFSIGYNQIANFHRNVSVGGVNDQNSITQNFANNAQGISAATLEGEDSHLGLAYWSYAIDTMGGDGNYLPAVIGGGVSQSISREERGRINEWSFGAGANFDDFLFIGGAIGLQDIRYVNRLNYLETDEQNLYNSWGNDSTPFNSLSFYDYYRTRGTGYNARFGIIVRPTDFFRMGASIQSPTLMTLTDTYESSMYMTLDNDGTQYGRDFLAPGRFNYILTTPYKANVGAMVLFKKMGFVSADFEITDYSTAKFSSANGVSYYSFNNENQNIRELFDFAYNFRIGAELRYEIMRFRGGFSQFGSVLNEDALQYIDFDSGNIQSIPGERQMYTGGLGFKGENYYIDLAYVRTLNKDRQVFYAVDESGSQGNDPELINKTVSNNVLMTIGFTF